MEVGVPMEMSFLTYNNVHDEFSVETHHKGSRLPPTAVVYVYIHHQNLWQKHKIYFS